jgi:hypothetical protein
MPVTDSLPAVKHAAVSATVRHQLPCNTDTNVSCTAVDNTQPLSCAAGYEASKSHHCCIVLTVDKGITYGWPAFEYVNVSRQHARHLVVQVNYLPALHLLSVMRLSRRLTALMCMPGG